MQSDHEELVDAKTADKAECDRHEDHRQKMTIAQIQIREIKDAEHAERNKGDRRDERFQNIRYDSCGYEDFLGRLIGHCLLPPNADTCR